MVGAVAMALETEVLAAKFYDLSVRIVASGAIESVGSADLMRAGYFLKFPHIAMAAVASTRCDGAQAMGSAAERRQIFRGFYVSLFRLFCMERHIAERIASIPGIVISYHQVLGLCGSAGFGGRGRSRGHIVMAAVALDAVHATLGML